MIVAPYLSNLIQYISVSRISTLKKSKPTVSIRTKYTALYVKYIQQRSRCGDGKKRPAIPGYQQCLFEPESKTNIASIQTDGSFQRMLRCSKFIRAGTCIGQGKTSVIGERWSINYTY